MSSLYGRRELYRKSRKKKVSALHIHVSTRGKNFTFLKNLGGSVFKYTFYIYGTHFIILYTIYFLLTTSVSVTITNTH